MARKTITLKNKKTGKVIKLRKKRFKNTKFEMIKERKRRMKGGKAKILLS